MRIQLIVLVSWSIHNLKSTSVISCTWYVTLITRYSLYYISPTCSYLETEYAKNSSSRQKRFRRKQCGVDENQCLRSIYTNLFILFVGKIFEHNSHLFLDLYKSNTFFCNLFIVWECFINAGGFSSFKCLKIPRLVNFFVGFIFISVHQL